MSSSRWVLGLLVGTLWAMFTGCEKTPSNLPILGTKQIVGGDTLYHRIPAFTFLNQDSTQITEETFEGKIYVADFFFTSCPTICPKMKQQMLRLHDEFYDIPEILLLSHSIDPAFDTPEVLKKYSDDLEISPEKWHLATGDQSEIYSIADEYLVSVMEDESVPGGFIHGGHFILVDPQRRIRGYYDGTKKEAVDQLMKDIRRLLKERNM